MKSYSFIEEKILLLLKYLLHEYVCSHSGKKDIWSVMIEMPGVD